MGAQEAIMGYNFARGLPKC